MNNDIYVRDWMAECPHVQITTQHTNGIRILEYGIYPSVVQPRYHENVLGELVANEKQDARFIFTAKMQYTDKRADRYSFYQNIIDWIEEQNKLKHFPRLNEGIVTYCDARISQYVSEPNRTEERNEIQIRFTYKRFNA